MLESGSEYTYTLKTLQGLEDVLAQEVIELGGKRVEPGNRSVSCVGDLALCYRLNYQVRSALAVLTPIKTGRVPNEQALYDLVSILFQRILTFNTLLLI